VSFLREKNEHFLTEEPALDEAGTTLLDNALLWLDKACLSSPRLRREYDALLALAEAQVRAWDVRSNAVAEQVRNHETRAGSARSVGILFLVAARVAKGIVEGHDTLAVFLTTNNASLPKNDEVLVLATALLAALCVTIWCALARGPGPGHLQGIMCVFGRVRTRPPLLCLAGSTGREASTAAWPSDSSSAAATLARAAGSTARAATWRSSSETCRCTAGTSRAWPCSSAASSRTATRPPISGSSVAS
jgi:hypothetical protein